MFETSLVTSNNPALFIIEFSVNILKSSLEKEKNVFEFGEIHLKYGGDVYETEGPPTCLLERLVRPANL